jgi:hypothetical protein
MSQLGYLGIPHNYKDLRAWFQGKLDVFASLEDPRSRGQKEGDPAF